jgi:hypothetical protein
LSQHPARISLLHIAGDKLGLAARALEAMH